MIEDLHDLAEPTGIQVTFEPCQDSKLVVEGDERLLRIAIFNLLQNAVKYNIKEAGKIHCEASGDSEFIVFSVKNTGPPISDSDKSDIFERFYRGARTTENEASGVGLGLSLARLVARAHGGDVEFVSSKRGWNEFRLSLRSAN